ncbi:VanZ family protein [Nocardioides coralli]|uniref:VanZ family protein n=1 Tax=Nocardioides coralli TaxID=2872154 RepID=UPI001CA4038B|nr:VanZ family protein [Nocardioides coralli]QZY30626.1 VanZ family protein [Nocardioides coralli]
MVLFRSDRERRLWWWTLAVVTGIYLTLGLAGALAGALRARGLIDLMFGIGLGLVVAAGLVLALRVRPGGREIGVALGVGAVYLLVLTRMAIPEERTHLIEYGVLALLLHEALREGVRCGRRTPLPSVLAILAASLVGTVDEGLQWILPNRVFDPVDLGFNALAATLAVGSRLALERARAGPPGAPAS